MSVGAITAYLYLAVALLAYLRIRYPHEPKLPEKWACAVAAMLWPLVLVAWLEGDL